MSTPTGEGTDGSSGTTLGRPLGSDPSATKYRDITSPVPTSPMTQRDKTPRELYLDRIEQIFIETVGRTLEFATAEDTQGRALVAGVVDDVDLLGDLREADLARVRTDLARTREDDSAAVGVPGDASAVQLRLATILDDVPPQAVPEFVRDVLAPTVGRLEAEGATREEVADIVIRPMRRLVGSPGVTRVARRLLGYLAGQELRDTGYFQSVDLTGDLLANDEDLAVQQIAALAYHIVVRGIRELVITQAEPFAGIARRVPSMTLSSLANLLVKFPHDGARAVARDLTRLAVIVAEPMDREEPSWPELLETLRIPADDPAEALVVVGVLGRFPIAWVDDPVSQSMLEAYGAAALAATGQPQTIPASLFNAGVGLIRTRRRDRPVLLSRAVLNLAGLRWAFDISSNVERLEDLGGLSCAVNFIGAVSDLRETEGESGLWRRLVPATRLLAGLPALVVSSRTEQHADRIAASLRTLGISSPDIPDDAGQLLGTISDAQDMLATESGAPETWSADLSRSDLVRTTAAAIGAVYRDAVDAPVQSLATDIAELVAARKHALARFTDGYAKFVDGPPPGLGVGPLVIAGVVDSAGWSALASDVLADPRTMVPSLRAVGVNTGSGGNDGVPS